MVREDDILLILYNNPWFSPSRNGETKALTNEIGKPVVDENGKQIEAPLSYYHVCSNGNRITIRVSNHGTALNTWVKHSPDPSLQLQNVSIVFADGPVTSERKTEQQYVLDTDGNKVKKYKYFVVEQFIYKIGNQTTKSIEKVIKSLEKLDKGHSPSEFKDPLRKEKSKKAAKQILTPQDSNGEDLIPSINKIHPRQTQLLNSKKKTNEVFIRITESDIKWMVVECVKRIMTEYKDNDTWGWKYKEQDLRKNGADESTINLLHKAYDVYGEEEALKGKVPNDTGFDIWCRDKEAEWKGKGLRYPHYL